MDLFDYNHMNGDQLDDIHNVLEGEMQKEHGTFLEGVLGEEIRKVVEARHRIQQVEDELIFAIENFADLKIRANKMKRHLKQNRLPDLEHLEEEVMFIVYAMRNRMYELNHGGGNNKKRRRSND